MKTFIREDLSEHSVPPRSVVKHLKVCIIGTPSNYEALLDGLLWSCHPAILSVGEMSPGYPDSGFNNKFVKVSYLFVFQFFLSDTGD